MYKKNQSQEDQCSLKKREPSKLFRVHILNIGVEAQNSAEAAMIVHQWINGYKDGGFNPLMTVTGEEEGELGLIAEGAIAGDYLPMDDYDSGYWWVRFNDHSEQVEAPAGIVLANLMVVDRVKLQASALIGDKDDLNDLQVGSGELPNDRIRNDVTRLERNKG